MQPLFHTGALAGAALVVLALSAAAYADSNSSLGINKSGGHRTLALTERTSSFTSLDLGSPGAGPGDQFTGTGDLLDAAGNKVGTSIFTCITAAIGIRQCSQVYELADGKITTTGTAHVSGTTSPLSDDVFAVIGGTGKYLGVVAQLRLVQNTTSTAALTFTFDNSGDRF
jgi:hypothetical protein